MKELNKIFTIVLIGVVLTTATGCSAKESKLAQDVMNTVKDKAKHFAEEKWQDIADWATEESNYVDPETEDLLKQASIVMKSFESQDEDGVVKKAYEIWINNICTDTDKKYDIKYKSYTTNRKHKDGLGIDWFAVLDDDVYSFGEYGDTYDAVLNY